jgi:hypothetical protein
MHGEFDKFMHIHAVQARLGPIITASERSSRQNRWNIELAPRLPALAAQSDDRPVSAAISAGSSGEIRLLLYFSDEG